MSTVPVQRFGEAERRFLLAERGVGPQVVDRLECAGVHTLAQLQRMGVPTAVLMVCAAVGSIAWANRRKPLERALARSLVTQGMAGPRTGAVYGSP